MAGIHQDDRDALASDARRRREYRRTRYIRRRLTAAAFLLLVLGGAFYGGRAAVRQLAGGEAGTAPFGTPVSAGPLEPLPFKAERYLSVADVDGDGVPERVAVGPAANALRQIGLVTGSGRTERLVGQVITVPDFPLTPMDLPRGKGVLVLSERLPATGEPREIEVGDEKALLAAGGEPAPRAWRFEKGQGLVPADYYTLAAPVTPPAPNALLVDKGLNVLWHYENGELVKAYRVATGRQIKGPKPSAANHAVNLVTPLGRYAIENKQPGMYYYKDKIPAGDPRNPLGTRSLGFSVYEGDKAAVWGIHGTHEPEKIGGWVSDGCIRLSNADVEALYARVQEGTVLEIIDTVNR